jgi:hypothetical protein
VYNQTSFTVCSCSNTDTFMEWRSFLYGWCGDPSPAAEGWLLACALLALCSLDQTAEDLITARNTYRPGQKQVRAHRRKCPLATATHHPQAAGETASMHENRSPPAHPAGQVGSSMAADPGNRATRYITALASGALSLVLEAQVQGSCSQAQGRQGNHHLDQRAGDEQSPSSVQRGFAENS